MEQSGLKKFNKWQKARMARYPDHQAHMSVLGSKKARNMSQQLSCTRKRLECYNEHQAIFHCQPFKSQIRGVIVFLLLHLRAPILPHLGPFRSLLTDQRICCPKGVPKICEIFD